VRYKIDRALGTGLEGGSAPTAMDTHNNGCERLNKGKRESIEKPIRKEKMTRTIKVRKKRWKNTSSRELETPEQL